MEKNVWVVWCKMEGCEGRSMGTFSIIGVFDSEKAADEAQKVHSKMGNEHRHYNYSDITRVELNVATHRWGKDLCWVY